MTSAPGDLVEMLEAELAFLAGDHPRLTFRFCRRMGVRISHLAGDTSSPRYDELRLPVGEELLLFVSGPWEGLAEPLAEYAEELAARVLRLKENEQETR